MNTNQGRYVLTSNGDLQIVQLHRTDAGIYVCVAYNGVGRSVEREINLSVDGESNEPIGLPKKHVFLKKKKLFLVKDFLSFLKQIH
jgi:hypothetical protein